MACALSAGRKEPCKNGVGGIVAVYFVDFGTLEIANEDSPNEDIINDLGAVTAYKYELKGTNDLTQNITTSRDAGTTYFEQVLTMALKKMDAASNKELKILAYGRPHAIVHYRNGDAVLVGEEEGTDVTGGSFVTGTAQGDMNGYNLTMTAMEQCYARNLLGATKANPFSGLDTAPTVVEGTNS